jgi:hypothetical protein
MIIRKFFKKKKIKNKFKQNLKILSILKKKKIMFEMLF